DEAQQESIPQEEGNDPNLEMAKKMSLETHQEKGEGEGDDADLERAIKLSLDPTFLPQDRAPVGGVTIRDPVSEQLPNCMKRDQTPHDSTTGPSSQPEDDTSEKVIYESSSTSDSKRTESATEATAPKGDKDQGEVDTSTVTSRVSIPVSDPEKAHEALAGPDPEDHERRPNWIRLWKITCVILLEQTRALDDEFLRYRPSSKLRVARLEQEMSEVKKTDHSADVLALIKSNVLRLLVKSRNKLDEIPKHFERHMTDLSRKYLCCWPESIKNQESEKSPKEIIRIKKGKIKSANRNTANYILPCFYGSFDSRMKMPWIRKVADKALQLINQGRSTNQKEIRFCRFWVSSNLLQKDDDPCSKKPRESDASASNNIQLFTRLDGRSRTQEMRFLAENKLQRKTYDIGSFIKWSCRRTRKKKLYKADLEGPAFNLSIHQWWIDEMDEVSHGDPVDQTSDFRGMNTMAEQNVPTQPPTRTDEQIVPRSQWLTIGKSNLLFNAQKIQKNPIFQISVDILSNTNFFQAFTASANVPAIYLQQFWNTMKYNEKTGADLLRKALAITPVNPTHPFELPPSGNTVIDFVNELGYPEPGLTGKDSGSGQIPGLTVLQMLWGIVTQTNVDHAELLWEEFTQGIQTFFSHKASHKSRMKKPKDEVNLSHSLYGRFSKVIIYYLASNNNIHRRPDSAVHHTGDDFILGNLKFVPKGETVEVFGMAIPDPLITEAIQQSSYYPKYLEMVAENTKKTPQESASVQPATKHAPPKKPTTTTPVKQSKPAPAPTKKPSKHKLPQKVRKGKPTFQLVDEDDEAQQESIPQEEGDDPDLELAKKMSLEAHQEKGEGEGDDADMERAIKLSLDPAFLPQGQAPVGGVTIRDPVSETTPKLPEVVGKGKAIVTEEQVAHSLIDLSKKKRTTDQFILVRRDQTPHDSTTGPSSQPEDDTSEKVIHESSSTSDSERTESETEAAAPKGDKDQGEVDSSTVTSGVSIPVSDPEKAHEALAGPDPEPMQEDQTGSNSGKLHVSLAGPNPEHMDDEFLATAYPKVHENLKLITDERVIEENPESHSGSMSSMKNLDDTYNFGDQFLYDKPTEDDQEKSKVIEESDSTIPDPSHQTVTSTPPVIAPFTDVSSTKPSSLVTPPPINTEATTITTSLPEITPFIALQLRVARLEQEMSEVKKTDHSADVLASIKSQVPTSIKNQESKKSPKEIIRIKREQGEEKQDSTYSIRSTDKVALEEFDLKSALFKHMNKNKTANRNPANYHLYHALMEALIADEDAMDKEVAVKVKDHKRKHDSDDESDDEEDVMHDGRPFSLG
ncbi:hypothetical protein Tco_0205167, partial [Tanacetum coccineum]